MWIHYVLGSYNIYGNRVLNINNALWEIGSDVTVPI